MCLVQGHHKHFKVERAKVSWGGGRENSNIIDTFPEVLERPRIRKGAFFQGLDLCAPGGFSVSGLADLVSKQNSQQITLSFLLKYPF